MTRSLTVSRIIEASSDVVFAAWTQPDLMRLWLATEVEADVRPGSHYRIVNREEDGSVTIHTGTYRTLEYGRLIVQTFRHEGSSPSSFGEELLEIKLEAIGLHRTELTLVHSWIGPERPIAETEAIIAGWNVWLDLLTDALTPTA